MDFHTVMNNLGSLGTSMIGPAKAIVVLLAQMLIQLLQYTISLLNLLVTKI